MDTVVFEKIKANKVESLNKCLTKHTPEIKRNILISRGKIRTIEQLNKFYGYAVDTAGQIEDSVPSIEYEMDIDMRSIVENKIKVKCKPDGSTKIFEPKQVIPKAKELKMYNLMHNTYLFQFPCGAMDMVSGGTHMHLHFPTLESIPKIKRYALGSLLFSVPFWMKAMYKGDELRLYNRRGKSSIYNMFINDIQGFNSYNITEKIDKIVNKHEEFINMELSQYRGDVATIRKDRSFTTRSMINSIEFRLNNVVDSNIVGYYRVMLFVAKIIDDGIKSQDPDINFLIAKANKTLDIVLNDIKENYTREQYYRSFNMKKYSDKKLEYMCKGEENHNGTRPMRLHLRELKGMKLDDHQQLIDAVVNIEKNYFKTRYFQIYINNIKEKSANEFIMHEPLPDEVYLDGLV